MDNLKERQGYVEDAWGNIGEPETCLSCFDGRLEDDEICVTCDGFGFTCSP